MQRWLREFAYYGRVAKELIFPRRCAVCATNIDNGYVCEQCRREYLLQRQLPCCPCEEYLAGQAAPLPTDVLYSVLLLYKYEGVFKDALHKIKFDGEAGCRCCVRKRSLRCPRPKCAGCSSLTLLPAYRLRLSDAGSVALMCRRSCLRASWKDAAWAWRFCWSGCAILSPCTS